MSRSKSSNTVVFFLALLLTLLTACQDNSSPTNPESSKTWQYIESGAGAFRSVVVTPDGGLVTAGTSTFMTLSKFDMKGKRLWTKTVQDTQPSGGNALSETDDGFVIGGGALIVGTDSQGNRLWSRRFGSLSGSFCNAVAVAQNGDLLAAGYTRDSASSDLEVIICRLTSEGDSLWYRIFDEPSFAEAQSIKPTADGGCVVSGYRFPPSPDSGVFLLRLNDHGDSLWSRHFGGDNAFGLLVTEGEEFLLMTTIHNYPYIENVLTKLDASGNLLWSKKFPLSDYTFAGTLTSDGGSVFVGRTFSQWESFAMKFDSEGELRWRQTYGSAVILDVVQIADSGFVFAGAAGQSVAFLGRVNANGLF